VPSIPSNKLLINWIIIGGHNAAQSCSLQSSNNRIFSWMALHNRPLAHLLDSPVSTLSLCCYHTLDWLNKNKVLA